MKRIVLGTIPRVAVGVLGALLSASALRAVQVQEVRIPMKDGVTLAADLWRPDEGAGPFPVLLEYLPYRKTESRGGSFPLYADFVRHGFVVARVDIRGTGNSEGTLIPYEYSEIEQRDCSDAAAGHLADSIRKDCTDIGRDILATYLRHERVRRRDDLGRAEDRVG